MQEMAEESEAPERPARPVEETSIMSRLDEIYINGSMEHRLPGNLNISFAYVEGESLLMGINDVAVSSGSACTSATLEPSYVLKALGHGRRPGAQLDSLRHWAVSTREAEVDYVARQLGGNGDSVCANFRRSTRWRKKAWICKSEVGCGASSD